MYNNIKNGRGKKFSNFKTKYLKDPIYVNNRRLITAWIRIMIFGRISIKRIQREKLHVE
jgi:hypothetical protein